MHLPAQQEIVTAAKIERIGSIFVFSASAFMWSFCSNTSFTFSGISSISLQKAHVTLLADRSFGVCNL